MGHRGTTKPAPTPVSQLGPLFKRHQKYHPARPYRWWEFEPTPPEAPEVARRRGEPGFWVGFRADVRNGIGFLLLSLLAAGLFKLFLIE
jgi:hypothetical protein